ncbi:MAG: tRNA lysidine(34) synthetase TilS [candidate division WOR-3 bacterium]|nr:MAG: tRNA lysidine(34) synthetase TilS [candidate division WOR-3 bacterium]
MRPVSVPGSFRQTVERYGLIPTGSSVLVAVSGGADSVCLFDLLLAVRRRMRLKLFGFHMNHKLRRSAGQDESFVRRLFQEARVDLKVVRSDVSRYAHRHRLGVEEAGRELRYRHLRTTARRFDCNVVALGHNADDNLETVLLNLCRGTGPHGMAGIPAKRGMFVRPLIDAERPDIVRYLTARGREWVEDESNIDPEYRRNLLRARVVPALRDVNARAVTNARRASGLAVDEDRFLDELASGAIAEAVTRKRCRTLIDPRKLGKYNTVLKRRAVKMLLPELDSQAVETMLGFLERRTRSCRLVLGRNTMRRDGEIIELKRIDAR